MAGSKRTRSTRRGLAALLFTCLMPAAAAQAQTCTNPVPNCSPTGAPVAPSANHHYFVYNGQTVPLLGMSYENICHICLPSPYNNDYCSLTSFDQPVFSTLQANKNNIVRLVAIFNSSPGFHLQGSPFPHEAPFVWSGSRWDLSQPVDPVWLSNIEAVVCSAYSRGIIVQVTLFDPWDPAWAHSPFNPVNTVNSNQGFTADQYFASFDNPTANPPTDSNSQNIQARIWQKGSMTALVNQIKRYPNIIWQIANEPDLNIPGNVPIANVVAWEKAMAQALQAADNTHMIMVNGHSNGSFAWNVPGATVESAHYTQIINSPGLEGAIGLMRDSTYNAQKAAVALGFDENQSVPNTQFTSFSRVTDDVRAEAWEFILDSGGLFNAYSYKRSAPSLALSTQLKVLYNQLTLTMVGGVNVAMDFNSMQQTTCGQGHWCILTPTPTWGTRDMSPGCSGLNQNIYWSTMTSNHAQVLYIHHGVPMSSLSGGPTVFDGYSETACGDGQTTGYQTTLQFTVPVTGCWDLEWVDPATGNVLANRWYGATAGQVFTSVDKSFYIRDVAVFLRFGYSGPCGA